MKKSVILSALMLFSMLIFLSGCTEVSKEIKRPKKQGQLEMILVKDFEPYEAVKVELDKLTLESDPILTDTELLKYSWATHEFTLSQDVLIERLKGAVPTTGKAFVLVADGDRIYLGAFWTPISSLSTPDIPIINSIWSPDYKDTIYKIDYFGSGKDLRNDERIREILKTAGKLK